ncbi:zonular occludens toxin domain-containing protein, partial [Methylophilus sp.]
MITIITGTPGQGKTALLVKMLLDNDRLMESARPVFACNIPDLKIPHVKAPPVKEWTVLKPLELEPEKDRAEYAFPPNSLLIVDEAQLYFEAQSSGSRKPPHIQALQTHRHTGLDIILISQKPMLMHADVRALCGRHIHLRKSFLQRKLYEWPEYSDVNSKAALKEAIRRPYKPPREAFKYYTSSQLHTKQQARTNPLIFALPLLAIMLAGLSYRYYTTHPQLFNKEAKNEVGQNLKVVEKGAETNNAGQALSQAIQHSLPIGVHPNPDAPETTQDVHGDPAFNVSNEVHPYSGFTFVLVGVVKSKANELSYYRLSNGEYGFTATSTDLKELGYSIKVANRCTAYLVYEKAKIVAICGLP